MKNYIVYMHICPNNKIYIGITRQEPKIRWNYGNGYRPCKLFYKAIKKYGWDNIEHKILYTNLTKEEAEQKEIELIKEYKSNNNKYGYNICSGGNGSSSHIVTEETKKKISENTRKAMDNETIKEKIRKSAQKRKGRKLSKEHKENISNSLKNKPFTEEHKEKLRDSDKNIQILCIETQTKYKSIHDAGKKNNIAYQNIYKVCRGKRKTAGGYHWKYV